MFLKKTLENTVTVSPQKGISFSDLDAAKQETHSIKTAKCCEKQVMAQKLSINVKSDKKNAQRSCRPSEKCIKTLKINTGYFQTHPLSAIFVRYSTNLAFNEHVVLN